MKCPFCKKEIKHLAVHVKKEHPKKFSFLKKHNPKLYWNLQKQLEVYQMVKSKEKNLFILKIGSEVQYYMYKCVKCGNCCHEYDIGIQEEDVLKWQKLGKSEFLKNIQIDPTSFAMGSMEFFQKLGNIDVDLQFFFKYLKNKVKTSEEIAEKINEIHKIQNDVSNYFFGEGESSLSEDIKEKLNEIENFILENHDYLGELVVDRWGNPIEDPIMEELAEELPQFFHKEFGVCKGKFPHWLLGSDYGHRAILSPKSFQVMKEGWKRGLRYNLIYEIHGGCGFLNRNNNLCSIHKIKPKVCKEFPYQRKGKLKEKGDEIFLKTCKGLKRIL